MGTLSKLESSEARMVRAISVSRGVTFGTTAPHAFGAVGFARIGFADAPHVQVTGYGRRDDASALVPLARQAMLRACVALGLPIAALDLTVNVAIGRERLFRDENKASASFGKNKRGARIRYTLEISDRKLAPTFAAAMPRAYFDY